jgi:O-antigen ligase
MRPADLTVPAAAAAVVLTALLGGGFYPFPRMVVGGALVAVWVLASSCVRGRLDGAELLLAAGVAWGVVSAIRVGSSPLAAKEALTIWITACLLFGICRRGDEASRRRALGILVTGAAVLAAAVVVEAFGEGLRVGGLLENPNVAAGILVPILPIGWWVLERTPRWRWAWAGLVATGIVGTGSRAGLLAVLVVLGFLLPRGGLRLAGMLAGSAMAIGVLILRFVSQPDVLAWHRVSIWGAVIKIWLTRPFTGVGPGCLVEAASAERILHADEIGRYQFVIGYAESTPLAILVQLGLVGVVLAVLAASAWLVAMRRSGALSSRPVVAGLAAMVTLGLFHDYLIIDPVLWWWAVLVGCLGGSIQPDVGETSVTRSGALRWSMGIVVIWVTAWGMVTPALARFVWVRGKPTTRQVVRTLRIEPWLSAAPAGRAQELLASPDSWSWSEAAEALSWSRAAVETHPGLARRSADLGRVHLRIITDLGGTDHDVEAARDVLDRACELDPHLPWHWLERARLERLLGQQQAAFGFVRRAISEEPNTVRAWLMLSRLELEQGRIVEAGAALGEAEVRANLIGRSGLTAYERELLAAPRDQMESLERILITNRAGRP